MSSHVRLLPTLIGAAGVLLFLRIGAMAADTAPEPAAPAAEAGGEQAPGKSKAGVAPDKPSAEASQPTADGRAAKEPAPPIPTGDVAVASSRGEADVLERLAERRAALDAREKDVVLREKMLAVAERQINGKLSELKQLEQKLEALVMKRSELEEAQIASLVKTYESMNPEDAARIFNRLERSIMVDVASRMKPAKIGAVLAAMEPARAQDLTVLLARRLKVTLHAPPAAPAAPVQPPTAEPPVPAAGPPPAPNG
jgi:flagellar motility protein MotE (MotC chaperone)